MFKFLKPKVQLSQPRVVSVEEIHNAIDTAEDRIVTELNELLASKQVASSSSVHKKAYNLSSLGFSKSASIKVSEDLKQTEQELERYHDIKGCYPLEKILTQDEFMRIINKYGLVTAPAEHYILDVPERVVNTLVHAKKRHDPHVPNEVVKITNIKFSFRVSTADANKFTRFLSDKFINTEEKYYYCNRSSVTSAVRRVLTKAFPDLESGIADLNFVALDKHALQIAAPASHFDPEYFNKINQKCTYVISDDPIAFEYIKGGFIRILDKWGTPDDQSYLDEGLVNEIQN